MQHYLRTERTVVGLALILAPLLLGISTFFWQDGQLGITGGTIQVYSFMLWIPAMLGLQSLLRNAMPTFAAWSIVLIGIVAVAGANFGLDGVYLEGISNLTGAPTDPDTVHAAISPATELVLLGPGLLFPLTLLLFGFFAWRTHTAPPLFAILLCIGAIGFPTSRVPRIELVAHIADLLLLIGAAGIGWTILQGRTLAQPLAAPATTSGD